MAVVRGDPSSVAIARGNGPFVLATTTIAVFDQGVVRPHRGGHADRFADDRLGSTATTLQRRNTGSTPRRRR
jgi:hypothetical protein